MLLLAGEISLNRELGQAGACPSASIQFPKIALTNTSRAGEQRVFLPVRRRRKPEAGQAGVSKGTVERLESGRVATQLSGFVRVCRALGLIEGLDALIFLFQQGGPSQVETFDLNIGDLRLLDDAPRPVLKLAAAPVIPGTVKGWQIATRQPVHSEPAPSHRLTI